jgi:predicted AAA+ superfamily ATPase
VSDYLALEIQAEAATRNIPSFATFLEAVALTHGRLINYSNMARECGVSAKTVKEYYQILEDTLLGHMLAPWRKSKKRRLIETAKFYLFDVGIARALRGMHNVQRGTDEFGRAFEHFMIEEIRAYLSYRERYLPLAFWRTSTGLEVDIIVGDMDLAVEFKASARVDPQDTRDLCALMEDQKVKRALLVSLDTAPRQLSNGIQILPWQTFCQRLWMGELV